VQLAAGMPVTMAGDGLRVISSDGTTMTAQGLAVATANVTTPPSEIDIPFASYTSTPLPPASIVIAPVVDGVYEVGPAAWNYDANTGVYTININQGTTAVSAGIGFELTAASALALLNPTATAAVGLGNLAGTLSNWTITIKVVSTEGQNVSPLVASGIGANGGIAILPAELQQAPANILKLMNDIANQVVGGKILLEFTLRVPALPAGSSPATVTESLTALGPQNGTTPPGPAFAIVGKVRNLWAMSLFATGATLAAFFGFGLFQHLTGLQTAEVIGAVLLGRG